MPMTVHRPSPSVGRHDRPEPFSGGGSIPLEAQRLGLRAYGSDLNPVAVLISKALVDGAPKPIKEGVNKDEAATIKKKFEEVGAKVEVK